VYHYHCCRWCIRTSGSINKWWHYRHKKKLALFPGRVGGEERRGLVSLAHLRSWSIWIDYVNLTNIHTRNGCVCTSSWYQAAFALPTKPGNEAIKPSIDWKFTVIRTAVHHFGLQDTYAPDMNTMFATYMYHNRYFKQAVLILYFDWEYHNVLISLDHPVVCKLHVAELHYGYSERLNRKH